MENITNSTRGDEQTAGQQDHDCAVAFNHSSGALNPRGAWIVTL